jgi:4-hydroxy-tetrahydrodipicolinate reductase
MGRAVSEICKNRADMSVTAGVDIITERRFAYPVFSDLIEFSGKADVVVDFSRPDRLDGLFDYCVRTKTPLVLATTGLDGEARARMEKAAESVAVFSSGNLSLGISLLADLVTRAATVLGEDYNIEIIERHHNQKLDAPSGTAQMLCSAASEALEYDPVPVYDRHERTLARPSREIGIHSVRGGTIIGEHEVVFAGRDEVITLSHSALSREIFVTGAIRAIRFIAGRPPGLYNMKDLLG